MDNNTPIFQIPGLEQKKAYNFEEIDANLKIYQELNRINEEIEKCRLENSWN